MKAVICPEYGPPEVLQIVDIPKPKPKPREVLIKIKRSSVTIADRRIRAFDIPKGFGLLARIGLGFTKPRKPILGVEWSGVIEEVGREVKAYKVGQEIFGESIKKFGGYQEYLCLNEKQMLANKPEAISFDQAVALPVGGQTALHFLRKAELKKGYKLLIYGASGSVGTYAIQLAKMMGAEVTSVCSSKNFDLVKSLGSDHVLDYQSEDFEKQLKLYDVIFVALDYLDFSICKKHIKNGGVYINITKPFRTREMRKVDNFKVMVGDSPKTNKQNLEYLASLVAEEKLRVVIDKVYDLNQIVTAHSYVDSGRKRGNVVIKVAD
ncbi:NAD(P)-dependent alcohol dehydrogenase [Jiulongibacter sp. NS-SX5]|uniref:NAD(P)-dependent alcohol dehydrogenase n=1 Tax=Jiulongibacter sp. NS-SX5 TaxID=3463854 RepID=UPI0040598623